MKSNTFAPPELTIQYTPFVMFNRNNLPSAANPFGAGQDGPARQPPRAPYGSSPAPPRRTDQSYPPRGRGDYDTQMNDGYGSSRQSPAPAQYDPPGPQRGMPARSSGMKGRQGNAGASWQLRPAKVPDNVYIFRNL